MSILKYYGLKDIYIKEAADFPELQLARVIAQYRGLYKIISDNGEETAEISGKLRYNTDELAKFPTVGDFVMVSKKTDDGNAIIHNILSRKSIFLRTAVGVSGQAQPVAANIDNVFICMSLNNNYNLSRLERYLAVAWDSGATPVILLTKSDLCIELQKTIAQVEEVSAFSDVVTVSKYDDDAALKIAPYLNLGTTSAFIGSSGVGKSTLINILLGEQVNVTKEVGKGDKGRHTTTGRELFKTPFGGVVIDTPGMRELGVESADLSKSFDDIQILETMCKFSNCSHTNEPGCAVIKAINDGIIDSRRLNSYLKLKTESSYEGLNSREIENKKFERMFKDVGGMKNARRIMKKQKY